LALSSTNINQGLFSQIQIFQVLNMLLNCCLHVKGSGAVLHFVAILTSCTELLFGNRKAHARWAEGGGKRPSEAPRSASVGLGEPPEKSGPRRIRAAHGPLSGGGKAPTAK